MVTTVKVLCYKSKTLSNGESPLMLCVSKDRKRKYQSLGISINPMFWDFEKECPKANCPNREQIERLILEKKRAYTEQVIELKAMNREFTASTLVQKVSNPTKAKTVREVFELYIKQLKVNNRLTYAKMYKFTLKSLLKFNGHLDMYFPDIDTSWLKKYEMWLHSQNLALNTLGTYFRI